MSSEAQGALYLCATPIGNLGDITLRALENLKASDLILAEDTRRTKILLQHYEISVPILSYHMHNRAWRERAVLKRLKQGQCVTLVSDAGMPIVSDPGVTLVLQAREAGIPVIPLPGASAVIAAFAVSGITGERFIFWGFLSRRSSKRHEELANIAQEEKPSILFEAPHRLCRTLEELSVYTGVERVVVIARELTKKFEEIRSRPLREHIEFYREQEPRGELTLVVSGRCPYKEQLVYAAVIKEIELLKQAGFSDKDAVRAFSLLNKRPKKEIYNLWLAHKKISNIQLSEGDREDNRANV